MNIGKFMLCAVVPVMLLAACRTQSTTSLAHTAFAQQRAREGEHPMVRLHIPNVRRIGIAGNWPEAFASIFGSIPIATAAIGAPIAVPLASIGGKTAVDLLRSGPDLSNDIMFEIDGLAQRVEVEAHVGREDSQMSAKIEFYEKQDVNK